MMFPEVHETTKVHGFIEMKLMVKPLLGEYEIVSYTSLILGGYILGNSARGFALDPCSIHLKNGLNPPVSIYPTILAVVSPLYILSRLFIMLVKLTL
jgi:hypothetical protein